MVLSRWCWGFIICFIVVRNPTAGDEVQKKEKDVEFSPEFMDFVRSLDSNIFHSELKKQPTKIKFIESTTRKMPRKITITRQDDEKVTANQTETIRDILMLKLVSYYEDKYKIAGTNVFTTPLMLETVSERSRLDTASSYRMENQVDSTDFIEQSALLKKPIERSFLVSYSRRGEPRRKPIPDSRLDIDEPRKQSLPDYYSRRDESRRKAFPDSYSRLDEPEKKSLPNYYSRQDEPGRNILPDYYSRREELGRKTLPNFYPRQDVPTRKTLPDFYLRLDESTRNFLLDSYSRLDKQRRMSQQESYASPDEPMTTRRSILDSFSEEELINFARNTEQSQEEIVVL
ncbi:hypothetical protein O0L34_g8788 [Tuta absoluta]|nr:hypothetical protein O0L34_g8788 [Tuta absoluta]